GTTTCLRPGCFHPKRRRFKSGILRFTQTSWTQTSTVHHTNACSPISRKSRRLSERRCCGIGLLRLETISISWLTLGLMLAHLSFQRSRTRTQLGCGLIVRLTTLFFLRPRKKPKARCVRTKIGAHVSPMGNAFLHDVEHRAE